MNDIWAQVRQWSTTLGDAREALMEEGFTSQEAFELVLALLKANS